MARIVTGLVAFDIDELEGKTCQACGGDGAVVVDRRAMRCEPCEGTGLVDRKVVSTVRVKVKPFDLETKLKVAKYQTFQSGSMVTDILRQSAESVRVAVKDVEGLFVDSEGKVPYRLEFQDGKPENGLTDKSVSDLMNVHLSRALMAGCNQLLTGIPSVVQDASGRAIPGVRVVVDPGPAAVPN